MAYQSGRINALATPDGQLHLYALPGGEHIASHALSQGKGEIVKNADHYRDKARAVADLEADIAQALGEALGQRLCEQLRRTEPQHYKDKLRGVKRHLTRLGALPEIELAHLADKEGLTVSTLLEYVSAWEANPERFTRRDTHGVTTPASSPTGVHLAAYAKLTRQVSEEVTHGVH
jgi:hypothetical protein